MKTHSEDTGATHRKTHPSSTSKHPHVNIVFHRVQNKMSQHVSLVESTIEDLRLHFVFHLLLKMVSLGPGPITFVGGTRRSRDWYQFEAGNVRFTAPQLGAMNFPWTSSGKRTK